jgi:WD40 repeat protein
MNSRNAWLLSFALAYLPAVGCTSAHGVPDPELQSQIIPVGHTPVATVENLDTCFTGTGTLTELVAVDNNDQTDHGVLLTFGISPGGLVAAAGADGTLKFWTMDNTLVGVADPGILTYGPEIGGAPITDLAFSADLAIAGDVRGLVQQLGPDGSGGVIGGTMPDVPIAAVAFDRATGHFAHAQSAPDITPLVMHSLDGSFNASIEDTMASITDLAFTADGALVVAGTDGTRATLEIRDGVDPSRVIGRPDVGSDERVIEVAAAREGASIAVVTAHSLFAVEGVTATLLSSRETDFRSVDLTPSGDYAITVDANGLVSVLSMTDGREVAHTTVPSALGVRIDADGQRAVVGGADAMLHVLACR